MRGDPAHPANRGKLCVKGNALGETVGLDDRLLHPQVYGARATWDAATAHRRRRDFARCIEQHGPDSVAFYVSGQLLTEDYYVANKLMKGYVGAPNIDTNSRLCMASAVAGHKRAFGEDVVPVSYEDLELRGSHRARGFEHRLVPSDHPAAHARGARAAAGHEDRRARSAPHGDHASSRTCTCRSRAGTDVHLFNGLLVWLADHGHLDRAFIDAHTNGFDAGARGGARRRRVDRGYRARLRSRRGAARAVLSSCSRATPAVITAFSQGVNQSSAGTDKVNAIINCHLATGRIGKPGAGPFSVTGQPNAMGGREVGGFANTLAAHVDLHDEPGRAAVQQFWDSPAIAIAAGTEGRRDVRSRSTAAQIKAVWIMATNPVVSLPDADKVREALRRCEFVAVSDVHGQHRHRAARARVAAGARLGREGRHGHELRSHDVAPAGVPAGAGRGARRLAHRLRRGARHGLFGIRFRVAARSVPRTRAPHRACERWPARVEPRRPGPTSRPRNSRAGSPPPGRWLVARIRARADVRRRQVPASRRSRALRRAHAAHAGERADDRASAGAQHRPRARSLAHDDAHRQIGAPVRARRRAVRGNQHRRCAAFRGARRRARDAAHRAGARWSCACAPARTCRPAWCSRRSTGIARTPPTRASAR